MIVSKPLNNNAIIALDDDNKEVIILGPGVGFYAKKGDMVDKTKIQKIFTLQRNDKLLNFLESISEEYLLLTEEICEYAEKKHQLDLKEEVHIALTDHIKFAIDRLKDNVPIDNPFVIDLKRFYPKEWDTGLYAKNLIEERFNIKVPDEEAGYIAMHIVANDYNADKKEVVKVLAISDMSLNYIKSHYDVCEDETSIAYARLVAHVRFFAARYYENREADKKDAVLNETIEDIFKDEVKCINGLSHVLEKEYGREISVSERNYLVLHLRNCKNNP